MNFKHILLTLGLAYLAIATTPAVLLRDVLWGSFRFSHPVLVV